MDKVNKHLKGIAITLATTGVIGTFSLFFTVIGKDLEARAEKIVVIKIEEERKSNGAKIEEVKNEVIENRKRIDKVLFILAK